jgi:hypothetical protein
VKGIILFCSIVFLTPNLCGQELGIAFTPISNVFHNKPVNDQTYGSHKLGLSTELNYRLASKNKNLKFGFGLGYQTSKVINVIPDLEQ